MATGENGSPSKQGGSARPSLTSGMRSSSFLQEHQQYRPPNKPENHYGIDTVVEDLRGASISPSRVQVVSPAFNGIPSPENPPTIVESGVNHDFSHPNCAGRAPDRPRLIATLFYKGAASHAAATAATSNNGSGMLPSPRLAPSPNPSQSATDIPANMAPTTDPTAFPLEPPAAEPEPLDRLYGSYISPLCITSFLHLMSTFPLPPGSDSLYSAHRCLDSSDHPNVVELTLDPAPIASYLPLADLRRHELIYRFEREWNVDVALQHDLLWRRHPRLVVFDMDSTLITQEVIDLLAATVTEKPELAVRVAEITQRAMAGELEFDAAFRERVMLLKGLDGSLFERLRSVLDVTPGVRETIRALKRLGVRTAVLSGGFAPLTQWLAGELDIDYAHANEVEVVDGKLTGEVTGVVVGKERKRELLLEIAKKEGIPLEQVVAVGDGANDLLMLGEASLGVAWNAKPMVQMEADARLNGESMLDLLYLFGFTSDEVKMLTA